MSSLNCFKRHITDFPRESCPDGSVRHETMWNGITLGQTEATSQETLEPNTDQIPTLEANDQSKFHHLQCESPRPASSSAMHSLKTSSLSSRYRMKLRNAGAYTANSPMSTFRTCVKGNSERSSSHCQVRKKVSKKHLHPIDVLSQPPASEDFDVCAQADHPQASGGYATRFGLSCLVRSHSDSTCLSVKAKKSQDEGAALENDLATPARLLAENNVLKQSTPQQTEVFRAPTPMTTPQLTCTDYPTPAQLVGFSLRPQAPPGTYFASGSAPYVGSQVTQSPGVCSHMSISYGLSGRGFCYPSPQLSTCSMLLPCHGGYLNDFQIRRCSYDGCGNNGAMILPSTSGPMSVTRVGKEYGLPHNSPMSFNSETNFHHPPRLVQSPAYSGIGGPSGMERPSQSLQQHQQQQPHFSQPIYPGRVQMPPLPSSMPPTSLGHTAVSKHNGSSWTGEGVPAPDRTPPSTAPSAPLPIRRQFGGISSPPPTLNRDFVKRPAGRKPPSYNAALESLRSHRGSAGEDSNRKSRVGWEDGLKITGNDTRGVWDGTARGKFLGMSCSLQVLSDSNLALQLPHSLFLPHLSPVSRQSQEDRRWERAQVAGAAGATPGCTTTPGSIVATNSSGSFTMLSGEGIIGLKCCGGMKFLRGFIGSLVVDGNNAPVGSIGMPAAERYTRYLRSHKFIRSAPLAIGKSTVSAAASANCILI
ncbi:unnamed protein product [Schistocephalus solidus]|uniref:Non-specific serine/threonine protein kinase n=1 Tax=Schistocephalus solidus TaxID=70667 RepID=A0A183SDQ8_SCHSO|nr:unnamed protein product [Schistocephalus solidus]